MLPPYRPFFNPVKQAHSRCLKSAIKQHLVLPHIQAEILDIENMRRRLVSINSSGEPTCCFELGTTARQQITQQKCANWCARIHRYIPASLNREIIRDEIRFY